MLWTSIYLNQQKTTAPSQRRAHKRDRRLKWKTAQEAQWLFPLQSAVNEYSCLNVRRVRARNRHVQSLEILTYALAQVLNGKHGE